MKKYACSKCGKQLYKKETYRCAKCGKVFCGDHVYSYVDGNNISITKNSPELCADCASVSK
jgi:DNA-directed RNA polymerase subunit RPC12/RpoP